MTQKDERITIRLTPAQREKLERIAASQGRTPSNLIRLWLDGLKEDKKE